MEDKEIEAWETKAKEGILRNDTQLNSILEALKNSIFKQVEGSNVNLNDFGISYPSDYSKRGQISLDENKLKNALINNSQDLIEYFTKKSTSSDINTNFNESGIINRIKDTFDRYTNKYNSVLVQKSGYKGSMNEFTNQFTKQMIEIERKVLLLEKKYSEKEKRLYMDFAKLESSMNQLNSQMTWLDSTINSE